MPGRMSQIPLDQRSPEPSSGCKKDCANCSCNGERAPESQGAASQVEPRDELLRFAANADELAQRIWDGQGTDLNHLIGESIRSRAA